MGKRFIKFRVFRAIPSFESCRSNDTSALPPNPVRSLLRHPPATTSTHKPRRPPPPSPPHTSKPHRSSIKRHVSSAFISARRGFLLRSSSSSRTSPRFFPEDSHTQSSSSRFRWGKDPKWHIIQETKIPNHHNDRSTPPRRKIYNSAASENENEVVLFPPLPLITSRRRRRRSFRRKIRISTSSDSGLFSDDDDEEERENEESDALVSTDSSTPRRSNAGNKKTTMKKKTTSFRLSSGKETHDSPARLSEFMRKMAPCKAVEGKVRESFAIVKRSEDPYEDFKRSMAEMVVEKQMFEAAELEELLRCFLSLNSVHHHQAIVKAFADIWEALFSQSTEYRSSA